MKKNKPNQFTLADIGASVVFAGFDGGSFSAKIVDVRRNEFVKIGYFPTDHTPVYTTLVKADWHRLTRFGKSNFLAIEVL